MAARFMVVERFREGPEPVYARFRAEGRMLPEGLSFCESWLAADGTRCFQVMETVDPGLFAEWTARWADLVEFEIVPLGEKPA
jgi:hypothetical protein